MSRNIDNQSASILVAAATLQDAGKLDRILAIIDREPILYGVTQKPQHKPQTVVSGGKTRVRKAGKVITYNQRESAVATVVAATEAPVTIDHTPVKTRKTRSDKGVKRGPRKPQNATPATPASKPADKPNTKVNFDGRVMLADAGTASKGQREYMAKNGIDQAMIEAISMADASNWRALNDGKITAAEYNRLP